MIVYPELMNSNTFSMLHANIFLLSSTSPLLMKCGTYPQLGVSSRSLGIDGELRTEGKGRQTFFHREYNSFAVSLILFELFLCFLSLTVFSDSPSGHSSSRSCPAHRQIVSFRASPSVHSLFMFRQSQCPVQPKSLPQQPSINFSKCRPPYSARIWTTQTSLYAGYSLRCLCDSPLRRAIDITAIPTSPFGYSSSIFITLSCPSVPPKQRHALPINAQTLAERLHCSLSNTWTFIDDEQHLKRRTTLRTGRILIKRQTTI